MKLPSFDQLILNETDDYLFINKPPGISTLADRSSSIHMLEWAKEQRQDLQVCHRLDKETSGILLFSKNNEAYRNAAIQFEKREVKKNYHALIEGRVEWEMLEVSEPIIVASSKASIGKDGKQAITYFSSLEIFQRHSLIECLPITGRMHQIRLHLSHLKHPIVGDLFYGGHPFYLSEIKKKYNQKKWEEERPLLDRVALHAKKLELKDLKGKSISAEASYPKDFAASLNQLKKYL